MNDSMTPTAPIQTTPDYKIPYDQIQKWRQSGSMGDEQIFNTVKSQDPSFQKILEMKKGYVQRQDPDWQKLVYPSVALDDYYKVRQQKTQNTMLSQIGTSIVKSPVQTSQVQKNEDPKWITNMLNGVMTAATAPGEMMAGAVTSLIGAGGEDFLSKQARGLPETQNLKQNYQNTRNNLGLYGGIVGTAFGMPGTGAAIGQAMNEGLQDIEGNNPNTPIQQAGDIAGAGLFGKLAGAGGANQTIYQTMLGMAKGQLSQDAIKTILGNNPNVAYTPNGDVDWGQSIANEASAVGQSAALGAATHGAVKVGAGAIEGGLNAENPAMGIAQGAMKGAQQVGKELTNPPRPKFMHWGTPTPNLDSFIDKTVSQALRPSVMKTSAQTAKYYDNVRIAVKDIPSNKDFLELEDQNGGFKPKGSLPESVNEWRQANAQMESSLFQGWDSLTKQATGKGAMVDVQPIIDKYVEFANDKIIQTQYPTVASWAEQQASAFSQLSQVSPQQLQTLVQNMNSELDAYYKNPNPSDVSKTTVTAAIKNTANSMLSDIVENQSVPKGYEGLFSELKKKYAAQKTIEADLNRRATVFARQNPQSLLDYSNIMTARDAVQALARLDFGSLMRGAATKLMTTWMKEQNNPNMMVKKLFQTVDDHIKGSSEVPILQKAKEANSQIKETEPINNGIESLPSDIFNPSGGKAKIFKSGIPPVKGEGGTPDSMRTIDLSSVNETNPSKTRGGESQPQIQSAKASPITLPEPTQGVNDFANLTPEEKATGLIGGSDSVQTLKLKTNDNGVTNFDIMSNGKKSGEISYSVDKNIANIEYVGVDKAAQGHGIGSQALKDAVKNIVEKNPKVEMISADAASQQSLSAFKKAFGEPSYIADDIREYTFDEAMKILPKTAELDSGGAINGSRGLFIRYDNPSSLVKSPLPSVGGVPKSLEPLAKEARKYKSAEEWLNSVKEPVKGDSYASKGIIETRKERLTRMETKGTQYEKRVDLPRLKELIKENEKGLLDYENGLSEYRNHLDKFREAGMKTLKDITDFFNQATSK